MTPIETVDHCSVSLVQHTGSDMMVAAAAWVSVNAEQARERLETESRDPSGTLGFLMANRHGTPFEHNSMTFWVDAPILVWREFHRHRVGFSYNEVSGRYSQLKPRFWVCPLDRKLVPAPDHKSSKPNFVADPMLANWVAAKQTESYERAYADYEALLAANVAKEVARSVLPVAIMSQCWVTCNARSIMHFLSLRTHEPTAAIVSRPQAEIEEVARQMEKHFAGLFPLTYAAWVKHGRQAP